MIMQIQLALLQLDVAYPSCTTRLDSPESERHVTLNLIFDVTFMGLHTFPILSSSCDQ